MLKKRIVTAITAVAEMASMTALSASTYQAGIAFQTDNTWTFRNAYGVDGLIRIHRPDGSIDDFDTNASFPNNVNTIYRRLCFY